MNRCLSLAPPIVLLACLPLISGLVASQEQSVRPGVNRQYQDPEWEQWVNAFERPGREVFDQRHAIVAAVGIREGMDLADIGFLEEKPLLHINYFLEFEKRAVRQSP